MKLMTANIQNTPDLPRDEVVQAGRMLSGKATIIGCQEIGEDEDHYDMLEGLGQEYNEVFPNSRNPIFYNHEKWIVSDCHTKKTHGGLAKTSGPRFFNWATFENRFRPDLKPFIVMNTHFVSAAWNNEWNLNDAWRRTQWLRHKAKMVRRIEKLNLQGWDVFLLGDMNKGTMMPLEKFTPNERRFVLTGIDRINYYPAPHTELRVNLAESPRRVATTSDHPAIVVNLTVSME